MGSGWGGGFGTPGMGPSVEDKATAVDQFTLTAGNISDGFVTLSTAPTIPDETRLAISGGTHSFFGVDFTITNGNRLSWNSLALDGLLVEGDELVVRYPTNI